MKKCATSSFSFVGIADYLSACYSSSSTAGGVILGFIVYPFLAWFYEVGAYVVFSIALVVLIAVLIDSIYQKSRLEKLPHNTNAQFEKLEKDEIAIAEEKRRIELEKQKEQAKNMAKMTNSAAPTLVGATLYHQHSAASCFARIMVTWAQRWAARASKVG